MTRLNPISKSYHIFGGYYKYYTTQDKRYFIKICSGDPTLAKREFDNLINNREKIDIANLKLAKPILLLEDKEVIITKYLKGKPLNKIYSPHIYFKLGKTLKKFHQKGFTHGHLEINDIILKNNIFYMVDLPFLNTKTPFDDLCSLKLSIRMFKIKRPWNWKRFSKCEVALFTGYRFRNYRAFEVKYNSLIDSRIKFLEDRGDLMSKLKSYLFRIAYSIKLL
ncbi:MAG: hypothetical protein ACFE85_03870 [Candidatus Hodarchaeota archaeon]